MYNKVYWRGAISGMDGEMVVEVACLPSCQKGVVPRYKIHGNSHKKKTNLSKETSFHSMSVHEVLFEILVAACQGSIWWRSNVGCE